MVADDSELFSHDQKFRLSFGVGFEAFFFILRTYSRHDVVTLSILQGLSDCQRS